MSSVNCGRAIATCSCSGKSFLNSHPLQLTQVMQETWSMSTMQSNLRHRDEYQLVPRITTYRVLTASAENPNNDLS